MPMRQSFSPSQTVVLAVTPDGARASLGREGGAARIVNDSKVNVWVAFGCSEVTASPQTSMLLTPGYTALVRLPAKTAYLAAVCPAKGSASLNITLGEGA
jgi:hypothetical protein